LPFPTEPSIFSAAVEEQERQLPRQASELSPLGTPEQAQVLQLVQVLAPELQQVPLPELSQEPLPES
jgi:hypothetical protein